MANQRKDIDDIKIVKAAYDKVIEVLKDLTNEQQYRVIRAVSIMLEVDD